MATLPTNRTTSNTNTEHVNDHNTLHTQHNVWESESPTSLKNRANHTGTQTLSTISDHTLAAHQTLGLDNITVRLNSGADIGSRPRLNFIEGTEIDLTIADDGTNDEIDITINSTATGGAGDTVSSMVNVLLYGGM